MGKLIESMVRYAEARGQARWDLFVKMHSSLIETKNEEKVSVHMLKSDKPVKSTSGLKNLEANVYHSHD